MTNNEYSVLSVSQINRYIKDRMDGDELLSGLLVRGELSNYKTYPSGHHYFTLKDNDGALRCVMFRGDAIRLRFRPENGMQVIAAGRITVFPRDGQYQLYCTHLTPEGAGELQIAFEQLKARLAGEGLFAQESKKSLPAFPERIALVTSPAGAAVRDMLRILNARWPMSEVLVVPVRVQGEEAAGEIAAAIDYVNYYRLADLVITGRGGGSVEDLWAFNEEVVARAIARSVIPVVSAVGHEPDVTISDFVADLRAATPSNAAELSVPDQQEVRRHLRQLAGRMEQGLLRRTQGARERLEQVGRARALSDPMNLIRDRRLLLDHDGQNLVHALERSLAGDRERFARLAASLDALSPLKVLGRGYAIARTEAGGIVLSPAQVSRGDKLSLRVRDGEIVCRAEEMKEETL